MAVYIDEKIELIHRAKRKQPMQMDTAHFHDKHELYFLESGQTKYVVGSEIYIVNEGDMVFVPKETFHKTSGEKNTSNERVLIVFGDDFLGAEYQKYVDELIHNNFIQLPKEHIYKISELCRKIESENKHRLPNYTQMQKLYLSELLITISRFRKKNINTKYSESIAIIQDAVKYIGENYSSEITLSGISAKYAMSTSYFSKQFKSVTGVGFNEYLNIIRVTSAEKLLISGDLPITQIAMECGFNDSNYFAAVFKKIKGITPKKYSMQNK